LPPRDFARILIVDDEDDLAYVMQKGLKIAGFRVDVKTSPLDAVTSFAPGKYDLLLLDIQMPEMNGFELYERLAQVDSWVKVCFLTAFDVEYFERFRKRFPNAPKRCFIKKPVTIANLVKMIKAELNAPTEAS
jgi:DNA-binding response OmpR family regulator